MKNHLHIILDEIEREREYQNEKWGTDFDSLNTPNDWVTYMVQYMGESTKMEFDDEGNRLPFDAQKFRTKMLKAITIGVACLETLDINETLPKRHYD